jgi:superfamily II DNA or RNA helicase
MLAKIELLDEVNTKIHGLNTSTRRKLYDKFGFMQPHAYYSPAYKIGRWDGKMRFFEISGKTYINLLEDILPVLIDEGYEVNLIDNRTNYEIVLDPIQLDHFSDRAWPEGHPVAGDPVMLRDYQLDIINTFLQNQKSVQEIATGAGKTLITAALSDLVEKSVSNEQLVMYKLTTGNSGARTIVIVPNKGLVSQTEEDYRNLGLDVGVYFGDRKEYDCTHTICTWQSLEVIQKNFKSGKSDMSLESFAQGVVAVIVDEAHGAKADVLKKMLEGPFRNVPIRWGLTGTVPEEKHLELSITVGLGPVVGNLAAKTLQDDGVLSNCHVDVVQLQDSVFYDNYQTELSYLTTNEQRLDYMANMIMGIAESGNTLILVDRIKTGRGLLDRLPEDRTVFISGAMKNETRRGHYKEVADSNDRIIIATYGVAAVGINIPRIFNMALIEPGKSFIRVIQSIGRGLRMAADKDFVNIFDITSSAKYSKRHLTERKKYYRKAQYPFKVTKVHWEQEQKTIRELFGDISLRKLKELK